ncbi:DinB family protein [Nonomuraea longicatena]|uniref:DinB family protein n=1 Tax=Nonomuraea longicatena TaxID=83682 RepID=A0ABN1NMB8_9ACTN
MNGPADPRTDPPASGTERELLTAFLDWERETLAWKCAGLSPAQMRLRSAEPSVMSLLGLVRHLTDVERYWFRTVLAGADVGPLYWNDVDDSEFDVVRVQPEGALAVWRAEVGLAREISARLPLETLSERERHGERYSHRHILIHLTQEYARHNGHADLLRERIDGVTGE